MHFVAMGRCADNTSLELLECWQAYSEQLHWIESLLGAIWLIVFQELDLPSLIWSKTPPTSWESEACGKKERTGVSVFLNVLINNTCDGPVSNPQTLSRTFIDSTKATRSDYPGQCRNSLYEIAKFDLIIQINALNWRRPRSFDCENILSQVESCPGFIPWFPVTTSHNTPKVISPNPERETGQGASLPSSSSSSFKTSPRIVKCALISFHSFATDGQNDVRWSPLPESWWMLCIDCTLECQPAISFDQ